MLNPNPSTINRPKQGRPKNMRFRSNRRGSVMFEFAIATPLLFFLFVGAFEFCRVAMIRHTVDNAVYEGCRQAAFSDATVGAARAKAESILGELGLHGSTIVVSPPTIDAETTAITMTIEVPLEANTFVPPQFSGGKTIKRTLTMQRMSSSD